MSLLKRRTTIMMAAATLTAVLSACGLQDVGVQGVVTAQNAGTGSTDGTGSGSGGTGSSGGTGGSGNTGGTGSTGGNGGNGGTGGGVIGGGVIGGGGTGGTVGGTGGGTGSGSGSGSGGGTGGGGTGGTLSGTINMSFVAVTGFDQLSQIVVVRAATTGDYRAQVAALEKYVNANGGIGGKRLVTHVRTYNAMQASAANDTALCNTIVGDDKSSFAIIHGQIHPEARACYKNAKVMALEGGQYGWSQAFYDQHSPYFWAPSWPAYDQILAAMIDSGARRGWFKGVAKVGIINWDDQTYLDLRNKKVIPALKKLGYTDSTIVTHDISNADIGGMSSGMQSAATKMIQNGVTHLMFIGTNPLQPFFVQQAGRNSSFVYLFNSIDTPRYMENNFQSQMAGSMAVGSNPITDVLDLQYPFPQPGMEKFCVDMYKSQGVTIPARYKDPDKDNSSDMGFDAKQSLSYCELTMLVKHVADKLGGNFSVADWSSAAEKLGTSFQMGLTFSTRLDSTHTGATTFRDMAWDPNCTIPSGKGCYIYLNPLRNFV